MDKKTQQEIQNIIRIYDDHAEYLKQESISELSFLKLINLSRALDVEEKKCLQKNIDLIAKTDAKPGSDFN